MPLPLIHAAFSTGVSSGIRRVSSECRAEGWGVDSVAPHDDD